MKNKSAVHLGKKSWEKRKELEKTKDDLSRAGKAGAEKRWGTLDKSNESTPNTDIPTKSLDS
jgi:hypothetical protein